MRLMMRALLVAIICIATFAAGSRGISATPATSISGDLAASLKLQTPSFTEPAHYRRHYRHYHRHHHRHYYRRYYYYRHCYWRRHRHHYHHVCYY